MPTTRLQMLAIDQELRNAIRLIRSGLGQLQLTERHSADFLHLPMLTLASGFERYFKVTLCFDILAKTKSFPTIDQIFQGKKGHHLVNLLNAVCTNCFRDSYLESIPVATVDQHFAQSTEVGRFVSLLSDFGQADRYYFLDVVLANTRSVTKDPERAWKALASIIAHEDPTLAKSILDIAATENLQTEITTRIIIVLERLARAIARLYTIGKMGTAAQQHSSHLHDFLFLRDEELGTKNYSAFGLQVQ